MNRSNISYWFQLSEQDRLKIFAEAAAIKGLPVTSVEKDWWVVQTLSVIFLMEYANVLIFKGGTSLSKGWNLIERFSEDIDLALDRAFLGFTGELSKSDIRKLRRKSYQFITETFTEELKNKFKELYYENVIVKYKEVKNHDQDPLIIEIYYPTLLAKDSYLKPAVLVEVGSRSLKEPFTLRNIGTIVSEVFSDKQFTDKQISIPIVNPERTFLEKIFLLHEEFQKDKSKIRVEGLSRHLYDIEKLSRTKYAEIALQNKDLYNTIVNHRQKFTHLAGIDYNKHKPENIKFIPPDTLLSLWEKDYQYMATSMIFGQTLKFEELIKRLTELQKRINTIS